MAIVIVGCGCVGSVIALLLEKNLFVKKILCIDSDDKRLCALENKIKILRKDSVFNFLKLDAKNSDKLAKAIDGYSVVINAASPVCNIPIMKACFASGANYIDLVSNPFEYPGMDKGATLDAQLELDKDFKSKKLLAVTNCGFSPGFTDLICKHFVEKTGIKSIDSIKIYFGHKISAKKLLYSWSPYTLLLEVIYPPTVYDNGEIKELSLSDQFRVCKFPKPFGLTKVRLFNGNPELRTIPQFIGLPVKKIELGGGIIINGFDISGIIATALTNQVSKSLICEGDVIEYLAKSFESPEKFSENYFNGVVESEVLFCLIEIVAGGKGDIKKYSLSLLKDIKEVNSFVSGTSVAAFVTVVLPVVLSRLIICGGILEKGVIAPGGLSKVEKILSEVKKLGLTFEENGL